MAATDRVYVMRQGQIVADRRTAGTSPEELAELMVGRKVRLHLDKTVSRLGEVALKGKSDIGDQINKKIIAPLANANKLSDFPDFNDAGKLGSGKEMVDRLTAVIEAAVQAELLRPETDCVAVATSLVLLSHGWVLKGYLLRKGRTPAAYAAALVETAVNGWATPAGRKAWERRRG